MTSTTSNAAAAKPEMIAETKQIVLKEIGAKWVSSPNKIFPR
jgi:hypothetical protein